MAQPQVQSGNNAHNSCAEDCVELLCPEAFIKDKCSEANIARWKVICCTTCFIIGVILIVVLVPVIGSCRRTPALDVNELIIRDVAVVRNVTAGDATPWQVSSDINITVSFQSQTPVIGCFTKLENMTASVYYGRDLILSIVSDFPLNITLKPSKTSRAVSSQLKGDRFFMTSEATALATELRSGNVTLELEINTPYKGKFERSEPRRVICNITATTPQDSDSRPGTLVGKHCEYIYHEIVRHAS